MVQSLYWIEVSLLTPPIKNKCRCATLIFNRREYIFIVNWILAAATAADPMLPAKSGQSKKKSEAWTSWRLKTIRLVQQHDSIDYSLTSQMVEILL
jgi:hypothetical protein